MASPAALSAERETVRRVVHGVNSMLSTLSHKYYLEVVGFEEVPSSMGIDAQSVINHYVSDDYDIFIGLMGVTLGSPTARATSGTVEEYERALARAKGNLGDVHIMFYFKEVEEVSQAVLDFRVRIAGEGLWYKTFTGTEELMQSLYPGLMQTVLQWDYSKLTPQPET